MIRITILLHNGVTRRGLIGTAIHGAGVICAASAGAAFAADPASDVTAQLSKDLVRYAGFGDKESGTPGELAAADWIADSLKEAGYEIENDSFMVPRFSSVRTGLHVGTRQVAIKPQPVVVPTPSEGISAKACIIRKPYQARGAAGRIAFLVPPYGRHASIGSAEIKPLLTAAVANKAQAIVIVPDGPTGGIVGLNIVAGVEPVADIPIALLAPKDFAPLEEELSEDKIATLIVDGVSRPVESRNIIARRKAGSKWIVFTSPRTGWFDAAAERGTGIAVFLGLCRWAAGAFPDHSLLAINSGGHELAFSGMHRAMKVVPPPDAVAGWVHAGAGLATRDRLMLGNRVLGLLPTADPQRVLMCPREVISPAKEAFKGISGFEQPIFPVKGAGELSGLIDAGYSRIFAGLGVHAWFHTAEDTLDKTDAGLLAPVLMAHMRLLQSLVPS
jgi:hypothetical protein